jgi:hypothetical protein
MFQDRPRPWGQSQVTTEDSENAGQTFKSLDGREWTSELAALDANRKYNMIHSRDGMTQEETDFETLPADQVRAIIEKQLRSAEQTAHVEVSLQSAADFIRLHPEYKDNDYNGQQMNHTFQLMGIHAQDEISLGQYDEAYQLLRGKGLLQLDNKKLSASLAVEADARVAQYRAQNRTITDEMWDAMTPEEREAANRREMNAMFSPGSFR